jgi:tRNA-binding protein
MENQLFNNFLSLDIRVGTVMEVKIFEKARKPAYQVWIDFGDLGIKKSSAQITDLYSLEDLIGKQVIAIVNFPARQIADFMSECLILGIPDEAGKVVLLQAERKVSNGLKIA